jgi:L-threonylcarbamoyladenylate synthase
MNVLRVDPTDPDPAALERAAEVLRGGALVAFPTETVYGLGAHALDPEAVERIYRAKGRPSYNPLIVHVADADAARNLAGEWPEAAERLAARFWPGPLTLVVPKSPAIPDAVSAGLATVALRVPAHPVAHALLRAAGIPVAAPSANRSTQVSPTTAEHVRRGLGDRVDLILDGGPCPVGIESTVLSLAGPVPTVLRPGTISIDELRAVIGDVETVSADPRGKAARPSPGMMDRHYAPRAEVVMTTNFDALIGDMGIDADRVPARIAILHLHGSLPDGVHGVKMPADAKAYASRLYAALHELDERGFDRILVEPVPETPEWAGVRDRLRRAATPHPPE